jgi:hypothetical protein
MKHDKDHADELPDVSYIQNADVRHEETDVRIKPLAIFLVFLFVGTVAVCVLMWGLFRFFEGRAKSQERPPSPLASERQVVPPEPQLQLIPSHKVHPLDEWKQMREEEEAALKNYGWVDRQAGVVRLPIAEAKRLLLERKLLSPSNAQPERRQP